MFCNVTPSSAAFFSAATTSLSLNTGLACALALHQTEFRLQVRWRKSDRRRRDRAGRQKLFRDQDRAAIELAKCCGVEQPCLELAPEIVVRQMRSRSIWFSIGASSKALRRRVVAKHLQQIVGAEIADRRFRRMRDLQIGLDAVDVFRPIRSSGPPFASQSFGERQRRSAAIRRRRASAARSRRR